MKKRLHDKKAGIAILTALILISLAEIIFRALVIKEAVLTTANLGESLAVFALAVTILILTAKGKDRASYICYGAWIAYFVLEQLFVLPGDVISLFTVASTGGNSMVPVIIRSAAVLASIGIIAIGILLVEYMNDGTICNRLFNILCVITIIMILCTVVFPTYGAIAKGITESLLGVFDGLQDLVMIFLFAFFAYDSAKMQLKKANLAK